MEGGARVAGVVGGAGGEAGDIDGAGGEGAGAGGCGGVDDFLGQGAGCGCGAGGVREGSRAEAAPGGGYTNQRWVYAFGLPDHDAPGCGGADGGCEAAVDEGGLGDVS